MYLKYTKRGPTFWWQFYHHSLYQKKAFQDFHNTKKYVPQDLRLGVKWGAKIDMIATILF